MKSNIKDERGFSMAETLTVVAIVIILLSLVMMALFSLQATLRQKELDSKAEIIYMAAQDQMTKVMASGRADFMKPDQDGSTNNYATLINGIPGDAYPMPDDDAEDVDQTRNYVEAGSLAFLTSDELKTQLNNDNTNAAKILFGSGGLDEELLNDNWVIEYDWKSLTVYSVFFNPDNSDFVSGYANSINGDASQYNKYRSYDGRLVSLTKDNLAVGYHGGAGSGSGSESYNLNPFVDVKNDEKLTATITCAKNPAIAEDLYFKVTVSDQFNHSFTKYYGYKTLSLGSSVNKEGFEVSGDFPSGTEVPTENVGKLCRQGTLYTLILNLDSLEAESQRFKNLYGSGHQGAFVDNNTPGKQQLVEGSRITVTVEAACSNLLVQANTAYDQGNSLFDDDTAVNPGAQSNIASITLGRHLQNLDKSSGIDNAASNISVAILGGNINFTKDANSLEQSDERDWYKTYSSGYFNGNSSASIPKFKSITNSKLARFEGKGFTVKHLYVVERLGGTGNPGGLFSTIGSGQQFNVQNVILTDATVTGGNAGALIGSISGNGAAVSLDGCRSYIDNEDYKSGETLQKAWVQGTTIGGLVGSVSDNASLSLSNCSASSVIGAIDGNSNSAKDTVIGGLVGSFASTGSLNIASCYADSYLLGDIVGGLVGGATNGSPDSAANGSIIASYSAGFIAAKASVYGRSGAGILASGGLTGGVKDSYTICDKLSRGVEGYSVDASYLPTVPSGKGTALQNVYYMSNAVISGSDSAGGVSVTDSVAFAQQIANSTNSSFNFEQESTPYNMLNNGLTTYTWPTISGMKHYGDWTAGFKAGALVYYEKYLDESKAGDAKVSYGFEGANVVSTLKNDGRSNNNKKLAVVGDGYGVVFDNSQPGAVPDQIKVRVTNPGSTGAANALDQVITVDTATSAKYVVGGYVVYPLPKSEVVNTAKVNSASFYLKAALTYSLAAAQFEGNYYFNPHFARTVKEQVDSSSSAVPSVDPLISIRTARQLHNLSLYYSAYSKVTSGKTFNQERNIDYSEYEWTDFASESKAVSSQKPIGRDVAGDSSFIAKYNGNCFEITDVSFIESDNNASYVGMFGNVSADAALTNIVLVTDYKAGSSKNFHVQYSGTASTGKTIHLGVLAGRNAGTIQNCAVAGYYVAGKDGTIHAYADTTVNLGGLVGTNINRINNCSADIPQLRLSTTFATSRAGGFVGNNNNGTIKDCYALGSIELADARGGSTSIAGFAGKNNSRISSCYAAASLTLSGENATSYGFAPKGGSVSGSTYLNGGTYVYVGKMRSHNFNTANSSGLPVAYSALKAAGKNGSVSRANSLYHSNTKETKYPFLGRVVNAQGELIHYGDWQVEVSLGTLGVFYWEHEAGGNNSGYHMTYLGSKAVVNGSTIKSELAQGTSLCTSHDDGGVIDSYGYGFYTVTGESVSVDWSDIDCSSGEHVDDASLITNINTEAAQNLKEQMEAGSSGDESYNFYAFTTRTKAEAGNGADDFIVLDSATAQNGKLKLTHTYGSGTSSGSAAYTFSVSPFFANAIGLAADAGSNPAKLLSDAADSPLESSDGATTDFTLELGKSEPRAADGKQQAGNPYEIRSVQQLQYLNWNSSTLSTDALIDQGNRKTFNYLLYASDGTLKQYKAGSASNIAKETYERADCHWVQTHDAAALTGQGLFSPIAGNATSSKQNGQKYTALAYAWFGSSFNGQSYTIKNINISSPSFNVGLFGMTIGATVKNVVMYSDDSGAKIERVTEGEYATKPGAYAIGGLIGIAYDYVVDNDSVKKSQNYIENCAISGYRINDFTTAPQGLGEMNMGGLIGVANVNLRKCSASVDMYLDAKFKNGVAQYGIYDRVGGLVGGAQGYITDCYTGGSFDFNPNIAADISWSGADNNVAYHTLFLSVCGIAGSAFTSNYQNITNKDNSSDGAPVLENCYTYFNFPTTKIAAASGVTTTLAMSTFASLADRAGSQWASSAKLTINNGYYYSGCLTEGVEEQYRDKQNPYPERYDIDLKAISYDDMALPATDSKSLITLLNGSRTGEDAPWSAVTTVDSSGAAVDGKFSFPTDDLSLEGKNFPFPAVVTQNDLTFGTFTSPVNVHVHYGNWPKVNTSYWEKGRDTLDIFDSMQGDGFAYKEFTLFVDSADFSGVPTQSDFIITGGDGSSAVAEIVGEPAAFDAGVLGLAAYKVKLKALNEGTATVTLAKGGDPSAASGAVFSLQITANLNVNASDAGISGEAGNYNSNSNTLTIEEGSTKSLKVTAASDSGIDYSLSRGFAAAVNPVWSAAVMEGIESVIVLNLDAASGVELLKVHRSGSGKLLVNVKAIYDYHDVPLEGDMYVTVDELAPIGLSNGTVFNEVKALDPSDKTGNDVSYEDGKEPIYKDSPLYFYTSNTGDFFDNGFTIKSLKVNGDSYTNGSYDPDKDFFVSFGDYAIEEGLYKFVPCTFTWNKSEPKATDNIVVEVTLENGPTLKVNVPADKIEKTKTATLTFTNGSGTAAISKSIVVSVGQVYELPSASALFPAIDDEAFDAWKSLTGDEYLEPGDEVEVQGDASFNAVLKHKLVLDAYNSGSSIQYYVGRSGISSFAEYDSKVINGALAGNAFTDWFDARDAKSTVVVKHDGQFEKDDISSFANGNGYIKDGVLYLNNDVTLYTQCIRWTLADSVKDKAEYLILDRNTATSVSELAHRASLAIDGKTPLKAKDTTGGDPKQDIWEVDVTNADVTVKSKGGTPYVSQGVSDDSVWSSEEVSGEYTLNGTNYTKAVFYLKNKETNLYLSDPGFSHPSLGGWWFIGAVEDPSLNKKIDWGNGYAVDKNELRCAFSLTNSKALGGFNRPENPYPVVFRKRNSTGPVECLTIENSQNTATMSYSYLYEKSISFDWS